MINYSKVINPIAMEMPPSGIRKYFGITETMPEAISLGVGEPDFITPQHILRAGVDSLLEGKVQYTANAGMETLRNELASYLERRFGVGYNPEDQILVTVGGSEAIDLCLRSFLGPGDEFLVPEPCFVCYSPLGALTGARAVAIPTTKENSFKLMPEDVRAAITPKTKLLLISYPSNPTGAVMTRQELQAIADVLKDTNIIVLSDEIYAELTYEGNHASFASLPGMWERTILISGFSKAFAMTGWRMGYCCGPSELMEYVERLHQYSLMCASTPAQHAALRALTHGEDDVKYMREKYDERRRFLHNRLTGLGFDCFEPQGAFYIFPDVSMFAEDGVDFMNKLLIEEKVAVVPGTAFGKSGKNHIRISYAYSMERLAEAMNRIELFIDKQKTLI